MKNFLLIVWICIKAFFKVQFNGKPGAGPMALIKFGQIIAEARGSVAGVVFSRNTAGSYMRQKVSGIQPRSVAQSLVRTLFAAVAQAWRGLSEVQRQVWNTVAPTFPHTNVYGDNVPLTGFGIHGQLNRNLQEIDEALISDAPVLTAVVGLTALEVVIDTSELTPDEEIQAIFEPAIPADQKIIVYATPQLSVGIDFVKSEFRKIAVLDSTDITPADLGDAYIAVFGAIPAVGTKAFIKFRPVVTASGLSGTELKASDIAV